MFVTDHDAFRLPPEGGDTVSVRGPTGFEIREDLIHPNAPSYEFSKSAASELAVRRSDAGRRLACHFSRAEARSEACEVTRFSLLMSGRLAPPESEKIQGDLRGSTPNLRKSFPTSDR